MIYGLPGLYGGVVVIPGGNAIRQSISARTPYLGKPPPAKEQQQYLTHAELRLVNRRMAYDGAVKTPRSSLPLSQKRVRSGQDVWRESRRVENDVQ